MSAYNRLMSCGFRNPLPAERALILQCFLALCEVDGQDEAPTTSDPEFADFDGGLFNFRACGKICRFVKLAPEEIARTFNTPGNPLKAALRTVPARVVNGDTITTMNILYANNGYVVLCAADTRDTTPISTRLSSNFADPTMELGEFDPRIVGDPQHIPRPPNAFILYRNIKMLEVKHYYPELGNNDVSKVVGKLWRSEAPVVKTEYKMLASQKSAALYRENPGYKYKPRKTGDIMRRPGVKRRRVGELKSAAMRHLFENDEIVDEDINKE